MTKQIPFKNTWLLLLSVTASLILLVGMIMVIADSQILKGVQYMTTATVYGAAIFLLSKNKLQVKATKPSFNLGFIFSIIGLVGSFETNLPLIIWALGMVMLLAGMFDNSDTPR